MTQIRTFRPYVVSAEHATDTVSPAYDSLSPAKRLAFREAHPHNYINAMRATDDFPSGQRPSEEQVLKENIAQLQQFLTDGAYHRCVEEGIFVYEIGVEGHTQTGIVAEIPIAEYESGLVRKHEGTRKEHEVRLSQYLDTVGASSSPICLAYEGSTEIDTIVNVAAGQDPVLDFLLPDGVRQRLWQVTDSAQLQALRTAFLPVEATYLTDGHHRAASTLHHAASRRAAGKGEGPWDYLLVVLFPADQLRVLPFNRCVRDLGDMMPAELLAALAEDFVIEPVAQDQKITSPEKRGQFVMLLDGQATRLSLRQPVHDASPVNNLDVSILQNRVLAPLLGIHDAREDPRLDYVTGDSGIPGLVQRCSEGWQLGFACFPTSLSELMAVADAGEVMPPKSTCFDPKPRSGIFIRMS